MRRKSCNCTKIDPQDVHCVVRGGSIVIAVIRMPWGDDMDEGSRREVDDLIHLKVRESKIARARLAKRGIVPRTGQPLKMTQKPLLWVLIRMGRSAPMATH